MTTLLILLGAGWLFSTIVVAVFMRGVGILNNRAEMEEDYRAWKIAKGEDFDLLELQDLWRRR